MVYFSAYILIFSSALLKLSTTMGEKESAFGVHCDVPSPQPPQGITLDVTNFGAVGDGKSDDSKAFALAWAAACQNVADIVMIMVPTGKTFLVSPIEFGGPCNGHNITFKILGSIIAQPKLVWKNNKKSEWLKFRRVDNLTIMGNEQGLIDGQGNSWWGNAHNPRPVAMLFVKCNNLQISGLKHIDSPKFHVAISDCNNVNISRLHIIAPSNSPNTDGIDIFSSTNIRIQNCTMETGDDCIAIKGGTSNVAISKIVCGPGHGISIGSLGQNRKHEQVEAITINNCTLNGTQNGVRIKTWQGGSGFARNISFSYINFIMADNPVIIDQFYCPRMICPNQTSAVEVSGVRYNHLYGTTVTKNATVSFRCSYTVPCTNIVLDGIEINSADPRNPAYATCINAHGTANNTTSPVVNCLES